MEIFGVKSDGYLKNESGQKLRPIGSRYEYKWFSTSKHDVSINHKKEQWRTYISIFWCILHSIKYPYVLKIMI